MFKKTEQKKKTRSYQGFSLVEVLVALFVFSILVTTLSGVYVGFLETQVHAKEAQKNLEGAQQALNSLAKSLRTSKIVGYGPDFVRIYDYSNSAGGNACMEYAVTASPDEKLQVKSANFDESECTATADLGTATSLIDGRVFGGFGIIPFLADTRAGRVTVSLQLCSNRSTASDCNVDAAGDTITGNPISIQTSVSLRVKDNTVAVAPVCMDWTYDSWAPAVCPVSGVQTRNILTTIPAGCSGGIPDTTQGCTPPVVIAETPSASPAGGFYSSTQSVTLTTATSGAEIRYTTNGLTPTASSTPYTAPISVTATTTIKAIAIKVGLTDSAEMNEAYTISIPVVATPSASPAGGSYSSTQSVTLTTATSGAEIRYTTNGSTPTASSTLYSGIISVANTQTIKAIAVKAGMTDSAVMSATYTLDWNTIIACSTFSVYKNDSGAQQWNYSNVECNPPQCSQLGGQLGDNLVATNTGIDFTQYPARQTCKLLGGRLPTANELNCIYANRPSYAGAFSSGYYWSSEEASLVLARVKSFSSGTFDQFTKTYAGNVRCVK